MDLLRSVIRDCSIQERQIDVRYEYVNMPTRTCYIAHLEELRKRARVHRRKEGTRFLRDVTTCVHACMRACVRAYVRVHETITIFEGEDDRRQQ